MTKDKSSNPPEFNTLCYACSFGFCDTSEKKKVFHALNEAWKWGYKNDTSK